jgi:RimJ/RimL family protein N-acetyltransferase
LTSLFDHVDARAYDDDEDSFVAVVNSECDMIDLPPTVSVDGVTLSALVDRDAAAFAAICRDREVNKYWGFDDTADLPDAPDEYYLEIAESELMRGVALSLAVRYEGDLVGEAVLFDFDYRGSAMAGVRLAKEYHGRGIGGVAFDALIEVARRIGLKSLRADVMEENIPSLRMIERRMERGASEGGVVHFTLSL